MPILWVENAHSCMENAQYLTGYSYFILLYRLKQIVLKNLQPPVNQMLTVKLFQHAIREA